MEQIHEKPLQIEADLHGFQSLATGGIKFTFTTLENVEPEQLTQFFRLKDKRGHLLFAVREFEFQDMINLPKVEVQPSKKSKSKQLRDVLWVLWNQGKKDVDFESFYSDMMDKLINHYKQKIE